MSMPVLPSGLRGSAIGFGAAPGALADPALTRVPTTMRAAPNPQGQVVQRIPPNSQIDLNGCQGGWCYASWRDLFGYVPVRSVEAQPYGAAPPPPAYGAPPPPAYGAPPVVVAPVFGWGWGWRRW